MEKLSNLVRRTLSEDAADRDVTAQATINPEQQGTALIAAKAEGMLSGVEPASRVFEMVDADIIREWVRQDADDVRNGDVICRLSGPLRALLSAERTALNFLQHLSGIATITHAFVKTVAGMDCAIVDTRKTTPGLRYLEKQAVVHGGGVNHRMDLANGMLIKENHIAAAGSIAKAVEACRLQSSVIWVEVECETLAEVDQAVTAEPDIILLDNMDVETVQQARRFVPASIMLEASGNITLANARAYAKTGVNRLAIGAITHSAPALDLSMRVTSR